MPGRWPCLGLSIFLLASGIATAQEKADIRVVKYAGLGREVLKHRGKVVLVEFWHTT